ncbi:MAG: excinuclease ABC subunit C [Sulfurospirillum sp.]|nr:MAG: excinuclease ABC subunit C [Sulfurospirillum sp.]
MTLETQLKNLPDKPGVYQYFDEDERLLYIGKAKSLKKRVKSYFISTPSLSPAPKLSPRIKQMISQTKRLSYIVVESEHDALILENSLIKQLKPKYNILLRDDKTYPYIAIDLNEDFPRPIITRKVIKKNRIKYFGPFSSASKEILDSIYELFPLVQKKGSLKGKKLCLFYQIKRCLGPCEGKIDKDEYRKIVNNALEYIYNKDALVKKLKEKMFEYSQKLLFEEANEIKKRIEKISSSQYVSNIDLARLQDIDVFSVEIEKNRACGVRIFIREGKIISSSHTIFNSDLGFEKDEIYKRMLLNYYQEDILVPQKIIISEDFEQRGDIEELLSISFKKKIELSVPKKGQLKSIINLAQKNAKEILRVKKETINPILKELKTLLNLQKTPYTIEGYDNSQLQGSARVGAMIKWEERFLKNEYRHYNLDSYDEYAQMGELLQRRVESFSKNPPPDLMVIDGGKALLDLAKKIIKESGANVDIVAIAKEKRDFKANRSRGRAKDIIYYDDVVLKLDPNDKRLMFLQRIRDESHRFAISFHRKQKLKFDSKISLLNKKGIGEATISKLLQYFEKFENIQEASLEELSNVVGIKIAQKIKNI